MVPVNAGDLLTIPIALLDCFCCCYCSPQGGRAGVMELEGRASIGSQIPHLPPSMWVDRVLQRLMSRTRGWDVPTHRAGRTDDDEDPACPVRSRPEP